MPSRSPASRRWGSVQQPVLPEYALQPQPVFQLPIDALLRLLDGFRDPSRTLRQPRPDLLDDRPPVAVPADLGPIDQALAVDDRLHLALIELRPGLRHHPDEPDFVVALGPELVAELGRDPGDRNGQVDREDLACPETMLQGVSLGPLFSLGRFRAAAPLFGGGCLRVRLDLRVGLGSGQTV